jgi:hypothetical protein
VADTTSILESLRAQVPGEEFDHQALLEATRGYAHPRDAITRLLRSGSVIRIAPGIYIFGPTYRRRPYSVEILANLIAGPSYVSLDYALQRYGLIPEGVVAVTSSIAGRPRRFETPVGVFIYRPIPEPAFAEGLHRVEVAGAGGYLIAGAEKALADRVREQRGLGIRNINDMTTYLVDSLRVDSDALAELDPDEMEHIATAYRSHQLKLVAASIRRLRTEG